MKKKAVVLAGIAVLLLIVVVSYFRPLSLSDTVRENSRITVIFNEYGVDNGKPDLAAAEYKDISADRHNAIFALLEKYPYRRTLGTLFSDGSMSGTGNKMLSVYVNTAPGGSIFVTSSGQIVVNAKNYRMENAELFIEQVMEIII